MSHLLPLASGDDPASVGGKAAGLSRLIRSGFSVPPGLCVTTQAYRDCLRDGGFDDAGQWTRLRVAQEDRRLALLDEARRLVMSLSLPQPLLDLVDRELDRLGIARHVSLAVRSSASDEDGSAASFAGVYRTTLGVAREDLAQAILAGWASLWSEAALAYRLNRGAGGAVPAMAVILQPMLAPRAAGVAYSRHPITGEAGQVMVNAVAGLAEPLVSGTVTPDQYVVAVGEEAGSEHVVERTITDPGHKAQVLNEPDLVALARLVKTVERTMGWPADVEWAMDGRETWLLQARPIPSSRPRRSTDGLVWSRANFKETLPDVPSPLGLAFLDAFMETSIVRHYRDLGCRIPDGWPSVRVMRGRPYINVSLFQSFTVQLGGDPKMVVEQMGGEDRPLVEAPARLPWWRIARAGLAMERQVRRSAEQAPAWFAEMKRMAEDRSADHQSGQSPSEWLAGLDRLNERLTAGDLTFAIVAGVSQGLYALGLLLPRRLGPGWRPLLNEALQGVGTIISAKQILWLAELADQAGREERARTFLLAQPWEPGSFRTELAGTEFLRGFDAYLAAYGHRAIGESDPMSPRFAEIPDYLLGVIRGYLQTPRTGPRQSPEDVRLEQESARTKALQTIRAAFGWRRHEWVLFLCTYRRLCRFLALREANRHHLMYFSSAARRLERHLGSAFVARGRLASEEDIFFLTPDDIRAAVADPAKDWRELVAARKAERDRYLLLDAPDTVIEGMGPAPRAAAADGDRLTGIPISAGYAEGTARIVRSPDDLKNIQRGDILVVPVIDPGMAPVLGLAAGLVVEMGGTLSHGAIIAREYGIPSVANVKGAARLVRDGERIAVDASQGTVTFRERS